MRRVVMLFVTAVCAAAPSAALAQAPAANPVSQAVKQAWDGAKKNITASAELMPEADYNFKPVDTVRTFGQIIAHIAGANYVFCAAAKGEKPPFSEDHFEKTATTREAIIKALADSMKYCDALFVGDDKKLSETIEMPFGMGKAPRMAALIGNTGHLQEHYGNLVTYFRIKGMVPPSSRR